MDSLSNATILIVGGTSGIGFATARRAAAAGAKPVITGRAHERLDAALAKLPNSARTEVLDFTDPTSIASLAERMSSIDHLVLSAASALAWGPFGKLSKEAVRAGFENKF